MAIAGPLALTATQGGDRLSIGLSLGFITDNLGVRCTRVESALRVTAVELDLAGRTATFLPSITGSLSMRARGRPQAVLATPLFVLKADNIGVTIRWTATSGE